MTLFPQDLGQRWHQALLALRHRGKADPGLPTEGASRKPSLLDLSLTHGLPLDEKQRATALGEQRQNAGCAMIVSSVMGLFIAMVPLAGAAEGEVPIYVAAMSSMVIAAAGPALGAWLLRNQMRVLHRGVAVQEVKTLREVARDDLECAFLDLIADSIELRLDPKIRPEVVAAFLGIAEAIERLPRVDAAAVDSTKLREDAALLLQESQAEPDEATAASIRRRAIAHLQQADAADQCRLIGRRSEALREEILAQIQALRTALVTMQSRTDDHGNLTRLAEAARSLAGEAVNVAAARGEVDGLAPGVTSPEQRALHSGIASS